MQVLILGCGDIGTRVGLSLLEQDWHVTAVRRNPDLLPEVFERCGADLTDRTALSDLALVLRGLPRHLQIRGGFRSVAGLFGFRPPASIGSHRGVGWTNTHRSILPSHKPRPWSPLKRLSAAE